MKIGINASFARKPDSGMGQVTINFLRKLAELKISEHQFILYLEEDLPDDIVLPDNFEKKVFLPKLYKRDDLIRKIRWEKKLLPKQVKKDGCDVLVSMYQSPTILKNTKHIMLVHDAVWRIFPQYLNNLRKKVYYLLVSKAIGEADIIITVSRNSKKNIIEIFNVPENKISVCPLDCDPIFKKEHSDREVDAVLRKYKLQKNGYIFYVGGFDSRKNLRRLFEAYGLLWKKYHKQVDIPTLALAGKFHPKLVPLVADIPEFTKNLNASSGCPEDQIKLLDFVPQEELPMLYKGADFFCYPSLYEGFGLPVLEAANSGCPIISSKSSSIPEVIDSNGAVLIDPRQSENIAIAMHQLLIDGDLKEKIVQNAKKQAEKFDWEKTANQIMGIITETKL